ncbi:DUF5403 family protein [Kitasatospora purpeofusca]|uniref:DUF5403 family protein n=1 Tax=Kitasatospora purpeofusca TaxID=67352 RepID=UPI0036D0BC80
MATVDPKLDERIAGLAGVMAELKAEALTREARAKAVAAAHIETGAFINGIKVRRYRKGYAIQFNDPETLNKNYGGYNKRARRHVDGIHAIEAAIL